MALKETDATALILLSCPDRPGVEESLKEVLKPFTLQIIGNQQIALRGRLILGILISCDRAHLFAIEADLNAFSENSGIDVAIDYSQEAPL